MHVLPYLNGLLGVTSVVIAGYVTAIFFKQKNTFNIVAITLIISTTPFFAHNLYFNTNISAWITLMFGIIKTLVATATLFVCSSCASKIPHSNKEYIVEKYKARITYYTGAEDRRYGSRVADPNTKRAKAGVTVAHHKRYKFGTIVKIPKLKGVVGNGYFEVQDRGPAINSKRASRGKTYVIDVYVKDKRTIRKLAKTMPMYMDVYIIKKRKK